MIKCSYACSYSQEAKSSGPLDYSDVAGVTVVVGVVVEGSSSIVDWIVVVVP